MSDGTNPSFLRSSEVVETELGLWQLQAFLFAARPSLSFTHLNQLFLLFPSTAYSIRARQRGAFLSLSLSKPSITFKNIGYDMSTSYRHIIRQGDLSKPKQSDAERKLYHGLSMTQKYVRGVRAVDDVIRWACYFHNTRISGSKIGSNCNEP